MRRVGAPWAAPPLLTREKSKKRRGQQRGCAGLAKAARNSSSVVALRVWAPGWVEMEWFASAVNAVVGSESDEEPPPHVEGAIEAEADGDRQSELQPEPEPQDIRHCG